ncbi:hypothetical protein D3C76_1663140 [compost metagenome]
MERVLGAAADWAGLAIAQLGAQFFDAGIACQALAFEQLAGQRQGLLGGFQLGLGRLAFGDQLLALVQALLLTFAQRLDVLLQLLLAGVQA